MGGVLELATRLRGMREAELVAVLDRRDVAVSASLANGISDFFDLAELLLEHNRVQQSLTRLDRPTLVALALLSRDNEALTPDAVAERLRAASLACGSASADDVSARLAKAGELLLVDEQQGRWSVYGPVREQLLSWPAFGLPSFDELCAVAAPAALEAVAGVDRRFIDRLAAERAFAATGATAELLLELERQPARELTRGGVALPDAKRLASAMTVDLDAVSVYLALAERGHLVCREAGHWLTTEAGTEWLNRAAAQRWHELSSAWLASLHPDIRLLLGERAHAVWGDGLRAYLDWEFPAGGDWLGDRIDAVLREAELLGVTAGQAPSGPGTALLAGRSVDAEDGMRRLMPAQADGVYLQHDLSVIAPGPLAPEAELRMRLLADVESRALATSYRISASSLNRALSAGETAESLTQFLAAVSKTGIPQPLEYLVAEASARFGLVRAGTLEGVALEPGAPGATSYVRSDDAQLISTIAVDQSLSALALVRTGEHRLVSRFALDIVFWSLVDARYPVAAEDAAGSVVTLTRHRVSRGGGVSAVDPARQLVARLRASAEHDATGGSAERAWLVKQIEAAIRSKTMLAVSVMMPGGAVVDYVLEPSSIAGGRLRAKDGKSDVERTLPLTSIAAVAPA